MAENKRAKENLFFHYVNISVKMYLVIVQTKTPLKGWCFGVSSPYRFTAHPFFFLLPAKRGSKRTSLRFQVTKPVFQFGSNKTKVLFEPIRLCLVGAGQL